MSKYIHLAREFFNEGEMRDIFSAETFFSDTRLYSIARSRGVILPADMPRADLVAELSRYQYSWRQFREIVAFLDKEDPEEKAAVARVRNALDYSQIEAAKNLLESKRSEQRRESYSITKFTDTKAQISVGYIERDPTRAKGLQRQKKQVKIAIDLSSGEAEFIFGRDERSNEIAQQFISCLRQLRDDPDEIDEKSIALEGESPQKRTEFFLELISSISGAELLKVRDVKLEQLKFDAVIVDDDGSLESEKDSDDAEADDLADIERATAGRIQSALLKGDDVLVTDLYNDLIGLDYFISYIKWEIREIGGDRRRVTLEAGMSDAQKGKGFFFDARVISEKDGTADSSKPRRKSSILDQTRSAPHF